MEDIKRVLWIDDYPKNKASYMFPNAETKIVSTMDEAIDEIAGKHLYDYDTIVLDIDFENGLPHGERKVLAELSKKLFLNKDQKNKKFIINNGGYLLFLYLLEKGYPSDQVAFLTGNPGIIGQLKAYTNQNRNQMSKEEIVDAFQLAWDENGDDIEGYMEQIDSLPIDVKYKDSEFVLDCAAALDKQDVSKVKDLIFQVIPSMVTGNIQNTGDMMIFRFHEANLESPVYFSKNDNDIDGHNKTDAETWLKSHRTNNMITRWLLLDAANYVEQLYRDNQNAMEGQVALLFDKDNDPGICSAFRQMFFVFDGLRNVERRGVYYQAISAMLIPFDRDIKKVESTEYEYDYRYNQVRRMFARLSKQARNYCAHNRFGVTLSNKTVLFIIACTLLGVLNKDQAENKEIWFEKMHQVVCPDHEYSIPDNDHKIDELCQVLIHNDLIDTSSAHVERNQSRYRPIEILRALGYNTRMDPSVETNTSVREEYFVFTLAAFIVKRLGALADGDEIRRYGRSVELVYQIANEIVHDYQYPHALNA